MKEGFWNYWNSLVRDFPLLYGVIGVVILLVAIVWCMCIWGFRKGWRYGLALLLSEYVLLIYCTTFFLRLNITEVKYNFMPFWSYMSYFRGENDWLLAENIMNVVVFVPIGLLAGLAFCTMNWKKVLFIGFCLSVGIETLQFVFKKGFSEVDDVIHNTLGCMIGYCIYKTIKYGFNQYRVHQRAYS